MALLVLIGFLAGVITAVSPCVLPVLPILLAGGGSGGTRRPYAIVAGLVASFVAFTLAAAWLIDRLGLPQDALRRAAAAFRTRGLRPVLGAVVALAAVAIVFNLDTRAQTALGGYTTKLQNWVEGNGFAERQLAGAASPAAAQPGLGDFGPAPDVSGISHWLNTPGDRPLPLERLRGKVVLIDFWTYSCINC